MLTHSSIFVAALALLAATDISASPVPIQMRDGVKRGYAAAAPDAWAANILKNKVSSYIHWENPQIDAAGNHQWIPMFWGSKKMNQWNKQKASFGGKIPTYILGQNELDVVSQANTDAETAAQEWCEQLRPLQEKGSKVGSATAYDISILTSMSKKIKQKCGGEFDFIAAHWYGAYHDLDGFKKAMTAQSEAFPGKKLWITEFATTASGEGTQAQTKDFMTQAIEWTESSGFVERIFYFGGWQQNPDGYANDHNRFFNQDGSLTEMGLSYQND